MKGQYFLLGAMIFCSLFFLALPLSGTGTSKSDDFSSISDNIEREFPRSVNLGLANGHAEENAYDFGMFVREYLKERSASLRMFWVISKPVPGTSALNVSVANFLGEGSDFSIEISGDRKDFHLKDGEKGYAVFGMVPSNVAISLSSPDEEKTLEWKRDKVNLYLFYEIRRGKDISRNSMEA